MNTYKLDKVSKLGDHDIKFGTRYWAETSDQLEPLMFNSLDETIDSGATITAEEVVLKATKKGQPYHQLKKVKVVKGEQPSSATEADVIRNVQADAQAFSAQLDRIEAKIDKLIGEPEDGKDKIHPFDEGEKVNLDDIPFN